MEANQEPFDIDALISLEGGVKQKALEAFFQGIADSGDAERWNEVARFASRAAWRVLPEILADESPEFAEPTRRSMFAASCHALFMATHPNADTNVYSYDAITIRDTNSVNAVNAAFAAFNTKVDANSSTSAYTKAGTGILTSAAISTHVATATAFAAASNKPLWQPLLLAMREDLAALHANKPLAGRELWPREAASLFDVNGWFETFRKNLERFNMAPEISQIYEALLGGRIERVILKYPPDLFDALFESTKSDLKEWQDAHKADDKDSTEKPADETFSKEIRKSPRDTLHPELPSATDHLNQERLAAVLSTWLNNNQSHAAIGLFGDWGVGKSTFVNLLRRHLKIPLNAESADDEKPSPDHYRTADYIGGEFNAWQYEHTDNIQAGLAQELIAALQANLRWRDKARLTWQYHSVDLFVTVVSILMIVFIFNLMLILQDAPWFSWLEGLGGLVGIGSLIGIGGSLLAVFRYGANALAHPLAKKLGTHFRLPSFVKELGTIPVMRKQVRTMANLRLNFFKKGQRLLFVVDDLDRCSPDAVVKVLEAVRLIMDLPNVVVLIAIDQKIALASLALRYRELAIHYGADPKSIARQYLGKVIHVPITLDNPAPEAVENYLRQKLWAADDPSETITKVHSKDKSEAVDRTLPIKTAEDKTSKTSTAANDLPERSESSLETPLTPEKPQTQKMPTESVPAQSSDDNDTEAPSAIESIGLIQEQKDAFIKWANKLGLANPRHIKRLDNAYNLIRMRYHDDEDRSGKHYYRLVMLMWIEYCRELPLNTYTAFRNYVRSEMAGEPVEVIKPLREKLDDFNRQVGLFWDEVKAVWEGSEGNQSTEDILEAITTTYFQVRTFVLPAIEKDNLKTYAS